MKKKEDFQLTFEDFRDPKKLALLKEALVKKKEEQKDTIIKKTIKQNG